MEVPITDTQYCLQVQEEVRWPGRRLGKDGGQAGLQQLHRDGDARGAGLRGVSPAESNVNCLRG